ncbi:MAG: branched-chain-amino-acid transaminase [Chthoniobacterales bacterium]|nr:branched-chain-amino-acid transaminase [Chthoniobacterales bacterium]
MQIYIDGKFFSKEEATISVFDHGLLYGDGIFEGIRFYGRKIFCLEAHIKRLYHSAKALQLGMPLEPQQLQETICECVKRNDLTDGYIRVIVTRGKGSLGLSPKSCPQASLIIIVAEIALYSPEAYQKGLSIITCATRRMTHGALSPQIKSLNYLNNIMAKQETLRAGVEEGLMLNEQGFVSECTSDNIFIVREGKVITPSLGAGALAGITRAVVIELARSLELVVEEALLTCYDIYTAQECFLTGTAAEIIPVVKLDERLIGTGAPGPITQRLIETFRTLVAA